MSASKKLQIPEKLRPVVGASIFFFIMIIAFMITSPGVFLDFGIYTAVFLSLPLFTIVGLGLVYITVAGEIDLSFPSIIALSGLAFAWTLEQTQLNFGIAAIAALVVGSACGYLNGLLVTKLGLSSLITTLGMNFALIGLTNILNRGEVRMLSDMDGTLIRRIVVGSWGPIPAQMFWSLGVALVLGLILHRHKFGIHVHVAGDNPEAGRAMGVNIERTKTLAFVIVGITSALTAMIAILLNSTYFATMGEGYLLPVLAAVFVGGTPVTGGRGTIGGLVIGAATVVFIQVGVVASGLDGYWTSLGFGLVIVLSLLGHRWFSGRLTR
ncbi:AraH Ribose/xylose/arabinose/galactoside ABC-type transport systems, permease components [Candidatus Nanopelagicaceae bacterium]|jgi:ribose/xylose/arabinose/galactoside ABC-type transport system permease subunit